jgi:hypothetical protein
MRVNGRSLKEALRNLFGIPVTSVRWGRGAKAGWWRVVVDTSHAKFTRRTARDAERWMLEKGLIEKGIEWTILP